MTKKMLLIEIVNDDAFNESIDLIQGAIQKLDELAKTFNSEADEKPVRSQEMALAYAIQDLIEIRTKMFKK